MSYPSTIDTFINPVDGQPLNNPDNAAVATAANNAISALETKVGVTGSADTTSIDYKLTNTSSVDPGHKHSTASFSTSGLTASQLLRINSAGTAIESSGKVVPTGTIVGDADSQTLTNKTINGSNNTISNITEAMQATSDVSTANVSITKHGYAPKAPNDATQYLDGSGNWSKPSTFGFATNIVTHNTSSTGNQNIAHGLGRTPQLVRITSTISSAGTSTGGGSYSFGTYNGTTTTCVYMNASINGSSTGYLGSGSSTSFVVIIYESNPSNFQTASVTFNSTNIILNWSSTGTPTGATANIMWEAVG